jgi:hypothetical protein
MGKAEKDFVVIEAVKKEIIRGMFAFWLVSTVFLFLRMFLKALGADPQSFFVALIYFISGVILLPFFGMFPNARDGIEPGRPTFDGSALTAIFCYTLLIMLCVAVTLIVARMVKTSKQVKETVEKDNLIDPTTSEQVVK